MATPLSSLAGAVASTTTAPLPNTPCKLALHLQGSGSKFAPVSVSHLHPHHTPISTNEAWLCARGGGQGHKAGAKPGASKRDKLGPSACRERPGQRGASGTWTAGEWGESWRRGCSVCSLEVLAGLLQGQCQHSWGCGVSKTPAKTVGQGGLPVFWSFVKEVLSA